MAQRILLTTEELTREATQLDRAVAQNKSVIEKCDSIVKNLLPGWEGDAQRAFANMVSLRTLTSRLNLHGRLCRKY